jgi:hypothetical protein
VAGNEQQLEFVGTSYARDRLPILWTTRAPNFQEVGKRQPKRSPKMPMPLSLFSRAKLKRSGSYGREKGHGEALQLWTAMPRSAVICPVFVHDFCVPNAGDVVTLV